jgi:hypothetical protein
MSYMSVKLGSLGATLMCIDTERQPTSTIALRRLGSGTLSRTVQCDDGASVRDRWPLMHAKRRCNCCKDVEHHLWRNSLS